jgi:hypothetical protein
MLPEEVKKYGVKSRAVIDFLSVKSRAVIDFLSKIQPGKDITYYHALHKTMKKAILDDTEYSNACKCLDKIMEE